MGRGRVFRCQSVELAGGGKRPSCPDGRMTWPAVGALERQCVSAHAERLFREAPAKPVEQPPQRRVDVLDAEDRFGEGKADAMRRHRALRPDRLRNPAQRLIQPPRQHRPETGCKRRPRQLRSEEPTSELQSLTPISYAVFCLKNKTKYTNNN